MSRFKTKEKRTVPQPPSGSLSDIVFMLLFFFMVTTTMRETENKVMVKLPEASEIVKLEKGLDFIHQHRYTYRFPPGTVW